MSSKLKVCYCGKNLNLLNSYNYNMHVTSCKKRKLMEGAIIGNQKISKFFCGNSCKIPPNPVNSAPSTSVDENPDNHFADIHFDTTVPPNSVNSAPSTSVDENPDIHFSSILSDTTVPPNSVNSAPSTSVDENPDIHFSSILSDTTDEIDRNSPDIENYNEIVIDDSNFPNDPSLFIKIKLLSPELRMMLAKMGPCQPISHELPNKKFPVKDGRSFSEHYYYKDIGNGKKVQRFWLSYSPRNNKVYCTTCKLFGLKDAQKDLLAIDGTDNWKHIISRMKAHECRPYHLSAEMSRGMYLGNQRVDIGLNISSNKQISENRQVVLTIFKAVLFLARQNLAFRGHQEDIKSSNKGNFLELVHLLGNYNPYLSSHLLAITENSKKNRITYLSNDTQNKMLLILSNIVREKIISDVNGSGLFSIIIDTTTDLTHQEQLAFVVRYVLDNGEIQERLLSVEVAKDATGKGLFGSFSSICEKYNINWKKDLCAQAFDGASSMQGKYHGLRTYIQNENPRAINIWCFAHILNLVIVDVCESNIYTKQFFSSVQALTVFMSARKRNAEFIDNQNKIFPKAKVLRLKNLSTTRWCSHDRAINVIYLKYLAVLKTLESLLKSEDAATVVQARGLYHSISSFEFIAVMIFMRKLFAITTPLSNYLQSASLDFVEALCLVDCVQNQLQVLRSEEQFLVYMDESKSFANNYNLVETSLKEIRIRRRKKMPGELCQDESITDSLNKFKIDFYYYSLDRVNETIENRFRSSRSLLTDLSLLSQDRILLTKNNNEYVLSKNEFTELAKWLPEINLENLQTEYMVFAKSYQPLENASSNSNIFQSHTMNYDDEDDDEDDNENEDTCNISQKKPNHVKGFSSSMLCLLSSHGLIASFPNIYLAYKGLCTIPASSASAERTFSKLKIIKNRLRSTTQQDRLESLILLSSEKDIDIDLEKATDLLARSSDILSKQLLPS